MTKVDYMTPEVESILRRCENNELDKTWAGEEYVGNSINAALTKARS